MYNNKIILVISIVIILIISNSVFFYENKKTINPPPTACTMEAKLCSDGSYVSRTGPNCEFTLCPVNIEQTKFNVPFTIFINDKVIFPDGLSITLKGINDSRCKPGLQCLWQGELSALFSVNIKGSLGELRLGTVNNKSTGLNGYTFSLESATEGSASIIVSLNQSSNNTSGINGYIHAGPTCPVQRIPPDPNCADRPFANAIVDILVKNSGNLLTSTKSNVNGNFHVNLAPETYIIKISSTNSVLPRCSQSETVVTKNIFTSLDISCDTGIR
jgi:hypothetical protein